MKPKIQVLTLGVRDLERSLRFYRDGLGLSTEGIVGTEFERGDVAFFHLEGGLILALFPRQELARDSSLEFGQHRPAAFSIGHNVGAKDEVDQVIAQAVAAGATVPAPACDRVWGGYSGYFQDLDGHLWEVVWNPQLTIQQDAG